MSGIYNITINQGANYALDFILQNNLGTARDLTGYLARMTIRRDYDKPVVLAATVANGKVVITPLTGRVVISFPPSDTSPIRFLGESLDCVYDVELYTDENNVERVLAGTVTISKEVTR
jgi:hypothetical protein